MRAKAISTSRGTLYILAIGVDKYPNLGKACRELDGVTPICDLDIAGADAKAFAEAMAKRAGPLHKRMVSRVLVNGGARRRAPTAANIADASASCAQTRPNDTVTMFLSGHGVNEGPDYQFVATDAASGRRLLAASSVVPWTHLQVALTARKGGASCSSTPATPATLSTSVCLATPIRRTSWSIPRRAGTRRRWRTQRSRRARAVHLRAGGGRERRGAGCRGRGAGRGLARFPQEPRGRDGRETSAAQEPQYFRARDAENYVLARPE